MYDTNIFYKRQNRLRTSSARSRWPGELSFQCVHCRNHVLTDPAFSGVQNRNHCPYCLWSKHLDLYRAGDRLAACKYQMQPVGLTLKKSKNKYANEGQGELMLIHLCQDCGRVSINRIAADDDPGMVLQIFDGFHQLDPSVRQQISAQGITPVQASQRSLVKAQLFGVRA